MSFNHQVFRAHLQAALLQNHLSLRDAAKHSGVSASTLSRLVNGETPDMETFAALVSWLRADARAFFDHEQNAIEDESQSWTMFYMALEALDMPQGLIKIIVGMIHLWKENSH
ncbi:MAG TPA: helix-turn-helix transcriptional regulator [Ktedonosporobacter sp.]|nr:helix-turn-helix transcriptional regulator [Ktedonosporobacter sp.]